jgi:apolipoprotein N-acyltransferase
LTRQACLVIWAASTLYWLVSLQGLRHAHAVMYLCWIALAGYLAVYHLLFVVVLRRMLSKRIPIVVAAPIAWVGQECVRNYLLTGISVLMLGHTMADVPSMIQIADLLGTYGVSFVLVVTNVGVFLLVDLFRRRAKLKESLPSMGVAAVLLIATTGYGAYRLQEPTGQPTATFALIQRNEEVEYGQGDDREIEIFQNYARQSTDSIGASQQTVDAVVWPESMFSGGNPWMMAESDATVPAEASMSPNEFQLCVDQTRDYFLRRAGYVQEAIAAASGASRPPHLLLGCGVVHYKDVPNVYSGVISIKPDGSLEDWYGKTHLVMFGEYVPIVPHLPGLRSLVPPGLGLQTGPGVKRLIVGDTSVAPNICIETAVERVTVNQMAALLAQDMMPDVVVTVTNDGWFDGSSVIDHHLRCGQLVAVGCRRPILSAANEGPTAWVDSCGAVVQRLPTGTNGAVIATPRLDRRSSIYVRIGDWPARLCVLAAIAAVCIRRNDKLVDES